MENYLHSMLSPEVFAFFSVVIIDLVLSADNGLIVGLAAASLPPEQRKKAIAVGILLATLFRILFAALTVQLLKIPGVLLVGGLLLLWVAYKMWTDLRGQSGNDKKHSAQLTKGSKKVERKSFAAALWQITLADISMSIDNVLAVAGASKEHPYIMMFGLGLSIVLMATVATMIANLLKKYPIIGYIGLIIIVYIAGKLTLQGVEQLMGYFQ